MTVALRSEVSRSFSLPENKLAASSQPQQPSSSASSSSLIASIEERRRRTSFDSVSASPPHCTVDRTPASTTDVKSAVCDVVVTPHDIQSPVRNVRPTLLDIASSQPSKVESSPDDRKPLVGILLTRSPRRNSLLRFVFCILYNTVSVPHHSHLC